MRTLLNLLGHVGPLSEQLATHIREIMPRKACRKSEILQVPDQPTTLMFYIDSGLLKAYRFEGKREICTWFQNEGNIVMSIPSWIRGTPTEEYIEALEDSVVYTITKAELDYIYSHFPEFNFNGRVLMEQYYLMVWEWFDLVRSKRAPDRYAFFVEHFGSWVTRVPSKDIATFLGVSKSHFSVSKRLAR